MKPLNNIIDSRPAHSGRIGWRAFEEHDHSLDGRVIVQSNIIRLHFALTRTALR